MKNILIIISIIGLLTWGVTAPPVSAADPEGEPIIIGVLENAGFAFAAMMKGSFQMAAQEINAQGGIKGRPIKLVFADDAGKKENGMEAVKHLARNEKTAMLVGGYSSSNTLQMARTAEKLDLPFVVCTAADDRITQRKWINIFRLNPPASEYATGLEALLTQQVRPTSMAIMYENSPYGTSGAMRMMWFCRDKDIEITAIIPYHRERAGEAYFERLLRPLKNNSPDVIYMVSYLKDGVALVKHIRKSGIDALLCGGAGGFTHPDFISKAGPAAQHLLTATLWTADQHDDLAAAYARRYEANHKQMPDYHGAEAYSVIMVAADALRRSPSLKADDIRMALGDTDLATPFGRVAFKSYGQYQRQNHQPTLVLQAVENRYQCVWPREVSVAELILPNG